MQDKARRYRSGTNRLSQAFEILENISDGFFALDRDWRFTFINQQAASNLRSKPEDLNGQNLWEKFPQIIGTEHEIHYRTTMQKGEPEEFETQGIFNNQWFNIRLYPSTNGISVYWQNITERKLIEEAFKRNLESFRETQTLARIGSWEYDLETKVITWSAETYVLYERDPEMGPPSQEEDAGYYSPEQYKSMVGHVAHAIETGKTASYDLEVRLPSRKSACHHTTTHPIKDAQGRVIKLYGIVQDITEQKQAEEKLKDSEEKYRNLVEVTSDFIWEVDQDGVYTYVSPKIYDILGYHPEEVLGKTPFDLMPPEVAERVSQIFQEHVSQKKPFNSLENINRHKNGHLVVLETSGVPFYGTKGKLRGYRGIDRDITLRKKAEEALAKAKDELEIRVKERTAQLTESEEKYRLLVDNASEFIAVAQDGLVIFTNRKGLEVTGYSAEEMIDKPLLELVYTDDRDLVRENYRKHIAGEAAPASYEFRFAPKDGSIRWAHISTVKINWNARPAILAIFTDITEQKLLEQELKTCARRITEVQEEERKRIAYEIHDDTAQYLSILKMQINALIHSGKIQSSEVTEKLQYLEKDADRAFNDVRRYSHELRPVVLENMGLVAALEQIAEDFNKMRQLHIKVNAEGVEPGLSEEIKLGFFRIAQEALNNTRKHSKADSSAVSLTFRDNHLEMSVRDNGTGFEVTEAANRLSGKGGLGLRSMQERAKLMGADLKIESEPGQGTTITAKVYL